MHFTFTIDIEVQRSQGKFATRDELIDQLREAIEGADPGQLSGENGGEYETCGWDVNEVIKLKSTKKGTV